MSQKSGSGSLISKIVITIVVVAIVCVGAATYDSCKRHNRACFGSSGR